MALSFAIFFLSGAAALIYEIVWVRSLEIAFGASTPAVSIVLAAFMGGLALGSWGLGRLADRERIDSFVAYALLELGIAAWALVVPFGVGAASVAYRLNYGVDGPGPLATAIRFVLVLGLLVVPTMLMGATLPVMARAMARRVRRERWSRFISGLYAVNTLGGVVGVGLAGFFLLRHWGAARATWCAVALNVAAAAGALLLARRTAKGGWPDTPSPKGGRAEIQQPGDRSLPLGAIAAGAFLAGFASLACEVVWSRVLKLVVVSNVFSVSLMLMAFLLGIAIGSILVSSRRTVSERAVPYLLLGMGLSTVLAIPLIFESHRIFGALMSALSRGRDISWGMILAGRFGVSLAIMLLPAAMSGALFPLLVSLASRGRAAAGDVNRSASSSARDALPAVGRRVGTVYGVNTAGGVLGSLLAGFVLIPRLGTQGTVIAAAALLVILGGYLLVGVGRRPPAVAFLVLAAVIPAFGLAAVSHRSERYLGKLALGGSARAVSYQEGVGASVIVIEEVAGGTRRLYTNGTFAINTSRESRQVAALLGDLPALFARGRERALVIGFGMGTTLAAVAAHPFDEIVCVEIVPGVFEAAGLFLDMNNGVLDDPRVRQVVEDGRSYLAGAKQTYDIITCDPIHPAFGSPALYTREYYELCRSHLAAGGVTVQYLPLHQISADGFRLLIATFSKVFPECAVFLSAAHGVLIGSPERLSVRLADLERLLDGPTATGRDGLSSPARAPRYLERGGVCSPEKLLARLALDAPACAEFSRGSPLNTDERSILEYSEMFSYGRDTRAENLRNLLRVSPRIESIVVEPRSAWPPGFAERLRCCADAGRYLHASVIHHLAGDNAAAIEALRTADALSPDDPDVVELGGSSIGHAHLAHGRALYEKWCQARKAESQELDERVAAAFLTEAAASLVRVKESWPELTEADALLAAVRSAQAGP